MAVHATTAAMSKDELIQVFARRISDILVFDPLFSEIRCASQAQGTGAAQGAAPTQGTGQAQGAGAAQGAAQGAAPTQGAVTRAGLNAVLGTELTAALLAEYTFEVQAQGLYLAFLLKPEFGGRETRSTFLDNTAPLRAGQKGWLEWGSK